MPIFFLKAWSWIRGHLLSITSVVAAVAMSYAYWQSQRRKVGQLKDAVAVEKARGQIKEALAVKEEYKARAEDTEILEQLLDMDILEAKRTAVELREKVRGMLDEEVEDAFDRMFNSRL
jgi:cbb3-type cytochrome oxidase cytochrome c subunit